MEISKKDITILKGVAILFMLLLHLFARKEVYGLYETFPTINEIPLIYYIALFGDACVPIFLFASGYGLSIIYTNDNSSYVKKNIRRIFKLLVNFWIILILFISLGHFIGKSNIFPGSVGEFLLNFFLLSNSYNGAWWFLQTYVILVLFSPIIFSYVKKYNSLLVIIVTGIVYIASYIQRIKQVIDFSDFAIISIIANAFVLVGTSLLPFIIGAIFVKEKTYSKFYNQFKNIPFKNTFCLIGILVLVLIHSLYESMIIAPFTAIGFICFFILMKRNLILNEVLIYLGNHSTNIWLVHMFFYLSIFPELTFAPKYPVLIFVWLLILCLLSSYLINLMFNQFIKLFENKVELAHKKHQSAI